MANDPDPEAPFDLSEHDRRPIRQIDAAVQIGQLITQTTDASGT